METFLIISIAILSYLTGRYHNYHRWRVSGRIYEAAKKTYKENIELKFENRFLKIENQKTNGDRS